jgi:hypothetical protein
VAYPTTLDNLPTNFTDATTSVGVHAAAHDATNAAVNALEAELGLLPKSTYATVRARLDAIQDQSDVYTFSNAPAARRTIDWADYSTDEALALLITFLKDAQDRKLLG